MLCCVVLCYNVVSLYGIQMNRGSTGTKERNTFEVEGYQFQFLLFRLQISRLRAFELVLF